MRDHTGRLQWDNKGRCKYAILKKRKCEGQPGYSGGCLGHWNDDYGSSQSCAQCHGSGTIQYWVYMPVPQFDAPRPPKNWIPDWVED